MLVKCETKSNRVKGLSFHPKLSWILASLHNGVIQLWDYRIGSLIDKFEEHEGPVRAVDFHTSQPLFVSGGDDYKLKVWNYRQRRCSFTLLGHLDYIRTVQFHLTYPWILSASDDQTVRVWNWQSRSCIAVLTGHNHYVMCAQFHPTSDMVVSASLDQTIRLWDTSGLRDKTVSIRGSGGVSSRLLGGVGSMGGVGNNIGTTGPQSADLFGTSDAVCKYILEGHERGVNWACCHPTLPLVASAADDRLIKLWRYSDSKAWEVDTLRGHFNNVSCVLFHPHKDLLLSNSEDRTIRVWDVGKRVGIHTFRRESDRFWMLTAHASSNLIAVGHDSGMVVFKLDRERPPAACVGNWVYFVRDKYVHLQEVTRDTSVAIVPCRKAPNAMTGAPCFLAHNTLNTSDTNLLLFYDTDGGGYDLVTCTGLHHQHGTAQNVQTKTGAGSSVAFVARNRFAVLEKSGSIGIYNLNNELTKRVDPPMIAEKIFAAGNNRLLIKSEEKVSLFDLGARRLLGEVTCPGGVRSVSWSGQHVALLSKHNVLLASAAQLDYLHSFHENIRVKGGAWDEHGAFVYSTLSHVKYCLSNGDQGIIHSLPEPIYIVKVCGQRLYHVDRRGGLLSCALNCTEYLFKLALHKRQFQQVALFIRNGRLCGNAVIGFLKRKGFPEVAMQFVSDPMTRFNLALDYGDIEEAIQAAKLLDEKPVWCRLGVEALRQGNQQIVEMVFQKTKNFERLSFLYLITGNLHKLHKMLKIAELRKDVLARYQNALMLGEVEERVRILAEVGQLPLAFATAKVHGLHALAAQLEEATPNPDLIDGVAPAHPKLLVPPVPVNGTTEAGGRGGANWPLLSTYQNIFDSAMRATEGMSPEVADSHLCRVTQANVDSAAEADLVGVEPEEEGLALEDAAQDWGDLDDALQADWSLDGAAGGADKETRKQVKQNQANGVIEGFVSPGERLQQKWMRGGQPMVPDLIAAGEFSEALSVLQKRIGLINCTPLESLFLQHYQACWTFVPPPGAALAPSLPLPILRQDGVSVKDRVVGPHRLLSVTRLVEVIREAHKLVTAGKFQLALQAFREVLQSLPLAAADNKEEEDQLVEFVEACRQYVQAMRIECARLEIADENPARSLELMAYFTCCKLQPTHLFLTLRRAMAVAWKLENYITTASFARRLLQINVSAIKGAQEELTKAKKVLVMCEQKGTDAHPIDYDAHEHDNLTICSISFTRLRINEGSVKCPFCGGAAQAQHKGQLCPTCELAELGARVLGIQFRP